MTEETKERPKSMAAIKAKEIIDDHLNEELKELDGLDMVGIKVLHFFMKEIAGFIHYQVKVLYAKDPKEIVLRVFGEEKQEFFLSPKDDSPLKFLAGKMGIPKYTIRFAKKGEEFEAVQESSVQSIKD